MRFGHPILRGTLLRRYKRFLADVRLESGEEVTVHCPNPGAMTSCCEPGRPVLLSDHGADSPRKLRYTWEAIRMGRGWVGINTQHPNRIVAAAVAAGRIPELAGYAEVRSEVRYGRGGRSRVDLLLVGHRSAPDCYVEIKNVSLRVGDAGLFPDAVTERGRRHLEELMGVKRRGLRAMNLFLSVRTDVHWIGPADHVDPAYGRTLRRAARRGVELCAYRARISPRGITLDRPLPVHLQRGQVHPP